MDNKGYIALLVCNTFLVENIISKHSYKVNINLAT